MWGLWFRVQGKGFRGCDVEHGVYDSGCRAWGSGYVAGHGVWGLGCWGVRREV
jgi:hypothetical protein